MYLYKLLRVMDRVVPVTIRAASCCIFSNESFSAIVQLSHTTDGYSKIGLRKEMFNLIQ